MQTEENLNKTWEFINEQIERNKTSRINWKPIFKMSLTRVCAKFKAAGLSSEQTFDAICFEHPEFSEEMKRRLKIGVFARFGEMNTEMKEMNKVKRNERQLYNTEPPKEKEDY